MMKNSKVKMGVLAALLGLSLAKPADDLVENRQLPNFDDPLPSDTYSGYLTVTDTKALHYVLVESIDSPENDPVLIWFNGGPGCSSLLGLFQEIGPAVVDSTGFYMNPEPWNKKANVLFLESPAGVGYTKSNGGSDWLYNDMIASEDAYVALTQFYAKFPEFVSNDLYVSGESYGGIYVPYLSWQVYQHNLMSQFQEGVQSYNLKGFLVGNGATKWDYDVSPSFPDTLYGFNLIPSSQIQYFRDNNCTFFFNDFRNHSGPAECETVFTAMQDMVSDLNWYDLYQPADASPLQAEQRYGKAVVNGTERTYRRGYTMAEYTPWLKHNFKEESAFYQTRFGDEMTDWINQEDVRKALHIDDSIEKFESCNNDINEKWGYQNEGSFWIYPILKAAGIRMTFYSGDTDGAVPTYGSKRWVQDLGWDVVEGWQPWFTSDGQVAGFIEKYDGLDFVTIKGVGHMAPQYAREAVTTFVTNWIHPSTSSE